MGRDCQLALVTLTPPLLLLLVLSYVQLLWKRWIGLSGSSLAHKHDHPPTCLLPGCLAACSNGRYNYVKTDEHSGESVVHQRWYDNPRSLELKCVVAVLALLPFHPLLLCFGFL